MPVNSNWEFIAGSESIVDPNHIFEFIMEFQRKPQYFILNLFLPAIILTILEITSFCIPANEVERASFSATVMLAMFLLHSQTLSYLPTSPNPILASYYAIIVIAFGMTCTVYSSFLYYLVKYHEKAMHKKLKINTKTFYSYQIIDVICSCCLTFLAIAVNVIFILSMSS